MRKLSSIQCDQAGFFLPYILGVTVIIMFSLMTHINLYQQDIEVTRLHLEHLQMETLIQMGYKKIQYEFPSIEITQGDVYYTFPNGTVKLKFEPIDDQYYHLHADMVTSNYSEYATYRTIEYEEVEPNTSITQVYEKLP